MSDDQLLITLIFAGLVTLVALAVLITYLAGGLVLAFTGFVVMLLDSSPILAILMFIVFPPTLILFLVGMGMVKLGFLQRYVGKPETTREPAIVRDKDAGGKIDDKTRKAVEKQRRVLGYED